MGTGRHELSKEDLAHALHALAQTLVAPIELKRRLEDAAEIVTTVLDGSNAFILVFDESEDALFGIAASDPKWRADFHLLRISMEDQFSISVRALKGRAPVVLEDALNSSQVRRELAEKYGERGVLALPLVVGDSSVGAIVVDDTRAPREWSTTDIERAELMTPMIALAIANARLFNKVNEGYAKLERANVELLKREQLASLGRLAATLAHEVRNPLGVLFNSIGTLSKMIPSNGDAATLLMIMSEEAGRLNQLVGELLDFARPVAPSLEAESLPEVVADAVAAAAIELGADAATMTADMPSDLPLVPVDARMLRRALVNLVVNGAQAAGRDGKVIVRGGTSTKNGETTVNIEIFDTGPGIPTDVATRIFEPFFTTKATGIGLGLAIVKSIVEAHRGEITMVSDLGKGTRFTVKLPVPPADLTARNW